LGEMREYVGGEKGTKGNELPDIWDKWLMDWNTNQGRCVM